MNLDTLDFAPRPVVAKDAAPTVKVAVLKGGELKLTLGAGAYDRLGKPPALFVETAQNGVGYLRLTPAKAGEGWPVTERALVKRGRPFASCTVAVHPFGGSRTAPSRSRPRGATQASAAACRSCSRCRTGSGCSTSSKRRERAR